MILMSLPVLSKTGGGWCRQACCRPRRSPALPGVRQVLGCGLRAQSMRSSLPGATGTLQEGRLEESAGGVFVGRAASCVLLGWEFQVRLAFPSRDSWIWGCNHLGLCIPRCLRTGQAAVGKVWVVLALPQWSALLEKSLG